MEPACDSYSVYIPGDACGEGVDLTVAPPYSSPYFIMLAVATGLSGVISTAFGICCGCCCNNTRRGKGRCLIILPQRMEHSRHGSYHCWAAAQCVCYAAAKTGAVLLHVFH